MDFVHHVDLQGKITGTYPFSGKFVKDADPLIIDDLKSRNLLFRSERIRHTYPFCWRCEAPLLYYAKQTWYIRTTAVKESLIAGNNEINWYPEHIKYGRFGDWLENNVDWAFSRERYWGTPLNIWRCESCGHPECVGSVKDLKEKARFTGLKEPLDLHRPFVDELTFDCPKCGAKNWLYYGHSQRAHANEPDACECHNCKHVFKLFDDDLYESDDPEDWDSGVGMPEPS